MLTEAEEWGDAISAFVEMRARGVAADGYACAPRVRPHRGRAVHAHAAKVAHVAAHPLVPGFLAGMYAESADVGAAKRVLETEDAPPVKWNVVVACCVRLGLVDDVPFTGSLRARTRSAAGSLVGM